MGGRKRADEVYWYIHNANTGPVVFSWAGPGWTGWVCRRDPEGVHVATHFAKRPAALRTLRELRLQYAKGYAKRLTLRKVTRRTVKR